MSVIEQYAKVIVEFETKGVDKVNNKFNKMMNVNKKGIVDLREAQIRAQKKISKGYSGKGVALPGSSPIQKINNKEMINLEKNFGTLKEKLHSKNVRREVEKQKLNKTVNEKTTRNQNAVNKMMSGGANDLLKNADRVGELEKRHNSFGRALFMNNENLNKFVKGGGEFSKRSARWGHKLRMMSTGLRGFKMELLGIMFFGMAMQRLFTGLLKPALELTGTFELWKTTLQLLMLPIALILMDFLMPIFKWLMNMDPATKLLIGRLVLLGAALGLILFVGGTLLLGLGAIIGFFSSMFNVIDGLIPDVEVLGMSLSGVVETALGIGIVSTLMNGFKDATNGALSKLLELDVIKDTFSKLGVDIDDSISAWDNFKNLFGAGFDKIKKRLGISDDPISEYGEYTDFMGNKMMGKIPGTEKSSNPIVRMFNDIKEKFVEMKNTIKDEAKAMGVTGDDGLIKQFETFGETIEELTVPIQSLADSLEVIAGVINTIIDGFKILNGTSKNSMGYAVKHMEEEVSVSGGGRSQGKTIDFSNYNTKKHEFFSKIRNIGNSSSSDTSMDDPIKLNDFLMRPGQKAVSMNPNDTVVGFKGNSPLGGGATVNQTLNITVSDAQEMIRLIRSENDSLINKLTRNVG